MTSTFNIEKYSCFRSFVIRWSNNWTKSSRQKFNTGEFSKD